MDRGRVLERCHAVLEDGGGLAVVGGFTAAWHGDEPWQKAAIEVITRYLGPRRRAGTGGFYNDPTERHEAAIARSPFRVIAHAELASEHTWELAEMVGNLLSSSFCNKVLLGDRTEAFTRDVEAALLSVSPSGRIQEVLRTEYIFALKDEGPSAKVSL